MDNETGATIAAPNEATDEKSDNLSLEDLTQRLMQGAEVEEDESDNALEPENSDTLDTEDYTEEGEKEDEGDGSDNGEPESQDEEESEPDVLSKFGIDLDTLGEEDAIALNKALGGKSHKRINQLVAQKKQLEEELVQAKAEASEQPQAPRSDSLDDVDTIDELATRERSLSKMVRELDRILNKPDSYDDDGNEYLYSEGGKNYTREDVKVVLSDAETKLDSVPERRKFLVEREEADKLATQYFPELDDVESPWNERLEFLRKDKRYKAVFNTLPNAKFVAGLLFLGEKQLAEAIEKSKEKPTKTSGKLPSAKPKTRPAPEGAGVSRSTPNSRKSKAVEAAMSGFAKSGSVDDFARMLELKHSTK